jgi:ligand-binding sensor domain-containing protein/putative methionine-R-sulfoxide reductase with GAF domain/anti-sigma regulatory factor (Ser/Thr protein kinase)
MKFAWFVIFSFYCSVLRAQYDSTYYQHYTVADGLSGNQLTGIVQDEQGYLWISTSTGLNRFDGKRFVQFHAGNENNSLPDDNIKQLTWLNKNKLAVLTQTGLQIIDTRSGCTSNIFIDAPYKQYTYKYNYIFDVASDDLNNIFVLTRSGFYHYNNRNELLYRFDYYKTEKEQSDYFIFGNNLVWIAKDELLLTADGGPYLYHTSKQQLQKLQPGTYPLIGEAAIMMKDGNEVRQPQSGSYFIFKNTTDSIVYVNAKEKIKTVSVVPFKPLINEFNWSMRMFRVSDTLFYVTSRHNGFFKMSFQPHTQKVILHPQKYLKDYFCTGFLKDREGRLWIATTAGLLKENTIHNSVKQWPIPAAILQQAPAIAISQVYIFNNRLYAACRRDGGLLVFDKNSMAFIKKISFKKYKISADDVMSVTHAGGDTLFIGTNGPLFWLKTSTGQTGSVPLEQWDLKHNWIAAQLADKNGNIWITTNSNKIYYYHAALKKMQLKEYNHPWFDKLLMPNSIAQDTAGNIWLGGQGLCRINRLTHQPDFFIDSFPSIRFSRKNLRGLRIDNNNNIWFGNTNNGLTGYSINTQKFFHYTMQNQLPSNNVVAAAVLNNYLWLGSEAGISNLNLTTKQVSSFGTDDGFPALPVTTENFYYDTTDHHLYAAFTNVIVRFNPDSLFYTTTPPQLFVESIRFGNDTTVYLPGSSITTSYRNNDLTVTIASIYYYAGLGNQLLKYRVLNANDSAWKPINGNEINFNNLSPGKYLLQLKLVATNSRWSLQTKAFTINVTPPFWKTIWFSISTILLLGAIIYGIYKGRVHGIKKTEREKAKTQQLRAEKFKTQLELEQISNYFSSSLAEKKNTGEILWDVAKNLIGRMGYEDCMIYLWNHDKTKMVQRAGYGIKNSPEILATQIFEVEPGQGVVGYVTQTKQAVIIADTRNDKRYRIDEAFRLSEICVPIIHDGELLGIIDSEHREINYFNDRDLKILTTIATLTGNKIKQAEAEQFIAVKKKEITTINQQLAEAQLAALQTQMNPHFIFNALNSIKRMILDNEQANASRYLSKFAFLIRLTLNHSKATFVTLRENINYLEAYLDMEQLRFKDSFTSVIELDKDIDDEDISIPSLMIQPLVENAVWHGLMHKEGEKNIYIRFSKNNNFFTCSIQDNGIGILLSEKKKSIQQNHRSVGLENLRNRIMIMNEKFNMDCSLAITDLSTLTKNKTGTLAVLKFKIRE